MQLSIEIIMKKVLASMLFIDLGLLRKLVPVSPECGKLWLEWGRE